MIFGMFTIFDSMAEFHSKPLFSRGDGDTIRSFADAVNDPQTAISKHPEHYTLFKIGTFDDSTTHIDMLPTPKSLGLASQFVISPQ